MTKEKANPWEAEKFYRERVLDPFIKRIEA